MLVFVFVPILDIAPGMDRLRVGNVLNSDPVVLSFVLVRGGMVLLDAFRARLAQGVAAGVLDGVIVSAWVWFGGGVSTRSGGSSSGRSEAFSPPA